MIARTAKERKTGARGLKAILVSTTHLTNLLFRSFEKISWIQCLVKSYLTFFRY